MNKKQKNLEYILGAFVIALFVCVSAVMIHQMLLFDRQRGNPLKGRGSRDDPYIIAGEEDYFYFAQCLKDPASEMMTADVALEADINLDDAHAHTLLGDDEKGAYFAGSFDGRGHSISGLSGEGEYVGLFLQLKGNVRNLNVTDCRFSGRRSGGITGKLWAGGSVENCFCSVKAEGKYAGGICGECRGTMENCLSDSDVPVVGIAEDAVYMDKLYRASEGTESGVLNNNARLLSPRGKKAFYEWEERDGLPRISCRMLPVISSLRVPVVMDGKKCDIKGFYSYKQRRWMLILPQFAREKEYSALVEYTDGSVIRKVIGEETGAEGSDTEVFDPDIYYYDDLPTVMLDLYSEDLSYLDRDKDREAAGELLSFEGDGGGAMRSSDAVLSGRGNDSFSALKKGYSLKLKEARGLLGMEKASEYNLIAGYRDNSLFNYIFTRDLYKEIGFDFAHDYRVINLYINGEPQGLYFLTEKMGISSSAFDLVDLKAKTEAMNPRVLSDYPKMEERNEKGKLTKAYYDIPEEPEDVTGGYLLEVAMEDYGEDDSRFMTDYGVILTSKGDKTLGRRQMEYISGLVQDYENAVYSPDGYNDKGKYYTEYIDVDSFADQWILYETMVDFALDNSVFYYKDSDITGRDGKIHASFYWDAEHMLTTEDKLDAHFLMRLKENGAKCDYNTSNSGNFWVWIYLHDDFREAVKRRWKEKFEPAYAKALSDKVTEGGGGLGSIEWYKSLYSDSYRINDSMYYDTDYRGKCDEVKERLERRMKVLEDYFK